MKMFLVNGGKVEVIWITLEKLLVLTAKEIHVKSVDSNDVQLKCKTEYEVYISPDVVLNFFFQKPK